MGPDEGSVTMEPKVAQALMAELLAGARATADLVSLAGVNLTQGLGVIQNLCIQQNGSNTDDSALLMALQAASRSPGGVGPNNAASS